MTFRLFIMTAALGIAIVRPAYSGVHDGIAAFQRGEFQTALRELSADTVRDDPDAQYLLGHMYQLGLGVDQDLSRAFDHFQNAAERGHPKAASNMAIMSLYGVGTRQDRFQAYFWLGVVVLLGDANAKTKRDSLARSLAAERRAESDRMVATWWKEAGSVYHRKKQAARKVPVSKGRPVAAVSAVPDRKPTTKLAPIEKSPPTEKSPPSEATPFDSYVVQLGAFRRSESVHDMWQRLRQDQTDVIGGLDYQTQRVDRGKQGVLHLLQTGPFVDESSARTLCNGLSRRGVDCFVVKF